MNQYLISKLKEGRVKKGLKQSDVTQFTGIKNTTLSNYENGITEPDIDTFLQLCELYELDYAGILAEAYGLSVQGEDFKIRPSEIEFAKKYRSLDDFGKERIDYELKKECERVREIEGLKSKLNTEFSSEIVPMRPMAYYQKMASAGSGEFLFNEIPTDIIEVLDTPLSRRANFVLGVNGHSMESTYFDGDKVLVEKSHNVPVGEIGVFIREGECFIKEAGKDRLISHNEDKEKYPDIIPDEREIDTVGIVLGRVGE